MLNYSFKLFLYILLSCCFLLSCQKTTILEEVIFDYSSLEKISINADKKEIIVSYKSSIDDPFIDHVMINPPYTRVNDWIDNNINIFGINNTLVIDIQDASITRKEIKTKIKVAGVMKDQQEYKYEIKILLQFILYNESNEVLATTNAKTLRSITSSQFISINERDNILDKLTLEAVKDVSEVSGKFIKKYMSDYLL